MKKFITDNIHIFVLVALVAGCWAAYKIYKANKETAAE